MLSPPWSFGLGLLNDVEEESGISIVHFYILPESFINGF